MGKDYNSRREFESYLQTRAVKDQAFRAELLSNTRQVVERELNAHVEDGVQLPDNIKLQVIEEKPDTLYLVIPPSAADFEHALSDEELEAVSGGAGMVAVVMINAVATTTTASVTMVTQFAATEVETAVNVHHKVNVK